ncbi:MAG: VCBS repeat-containing protein [Bacteroidetes bacterium]|nr:VCBS repeat-containing protein [Bacteroidota bacterium]
MKGYMKILALIALFFAMGCGNGSKDQTESASGNNVEATTEPLFVRVDQAHSGITFSNDLAEDDKQNYFDYEYIYNGGGVALGDIDNDGLTDIYFTGNSVDNKLYRNLGNMQFEEITATAGVAAEGLWCQGVTMVDINNDGFLDIYVCVSYTDDSDEKRRNLFYINNGDLTFTEQSEKYGLDDKGYSNQAVFFDYDNDGDLDMYLGNHPRAFLDDSRMQLFNWMNPKIATSDKLYRNNGDQTFTDVTVKVGMLNYGYALNVMAADINGDGWQDIYVSNDYVEQDYMYLNNGDGTFDMVSNEVFKHISNFGMGSDLADFNNDGQIDICVLDMTAEDNFRQKTNMGAMAPETFWKHVEQGYGIQYMRNTLQLNNGNGTFSEIGQLAGIANTDWSWAPLLADFDNDGLKDLFITNGYRRDAANKDAAAKINENLDENNNSVSNLKEGQLDEIYDLIPSVKLVNYAFKNNGDLTFTKITGQWGLGDASFSNGAAYGDLDNDGDLDLVVNNLMEPAFLYKNNANEINQNNFVRVKLNGDIPNILGIGAHVKLRYGDQIQYQELTLTRGYQSSVEGILHFGLGDVTNIDELVVTWSNGKEQRIKNVEINKVIILEQKNATDPTDIYDWADSPIFAEVTERGVNFEHQENEYDDYVKEILLPHKMSQFGPNISTGDVNGDGLTDFYIGGAIGQSGALYFNKGDYTFSKSSGAAFYDDSYHEDIGSLMFDADGDGDLDLYVVSGGNEFDITSPELQDRLYLNNGQGKFELSIGTLPEMLTSGSCVVAGDYDKDGDLDLFVGGRVVPGSYPFPARSYILNNDAGKFTDVTEKVAPDLVKPGMVTSAVWTDFDNDGSLDLIVVGEWMPISIYRNENGIFVDLTFSAGMENTAGWWNKIVEADCDGDGDMDYIIGNRGLNYKYVATETEPLHLYCHDFDNSGSLDIVLGYYNSGTCYPVRGRQCSSEQMPFIKEKFTNYESFGRASLLDVYGDDLQVALQHHEAKMFESVYLENKGAGEFGITALPVRAQFSTVYGIIAGDFTDNGKIDLVIAGNFYVSEVETGRADASIGLILEGNGDGSFKPLTAKESGFFADLDVRDLAIINDNGGRMILVANNNDKMQIFKTGAVNSITSTK